MSILNSGANNTHTHTHTHTQAKREYRIKLIKGFTKLVFASLVGVSLLFFSINTATANGAKEFDFPEKLTKKDLAVIQKSTGKYQMTLSTAMGDGRLNWYILVWDTQTGRSKFYYGNAKGGTRAAHSTYSLPSFPL